VLFRVMRYRASMTASTAEEFFDNELAHEDSELSVYDIESQNCARAHVEHNASARLDPPRNSGGFDVTSLGWNHSADDPCLHFSFTNAAHRLLATPTAHERQQVAAQLFADLEVFFVEVTKDAMRSHVRMCVEAKDPEWVGFLSSANSKWQKFAT